MCRAQHFTCIISLNPHGGPRGEIQLLSSFAYKESEKQRATHQACTGAHSEDKVKSGFESKRSDSWPHMNHYSKFIFSKPRIPRQPPSPYQALPYLFGSEQIKGYQSIDNTPACSLCITQHSAPYRPGYAIATTGYPLSQLPLSHPGLNCHIYPCLRKNRNCNIFLEVINEK